MNNTKDNKWQLLLILILAVAVLTLTVLSYFNHRDSTEKLTFFDNEKKLFQMELNNMIRKNDSLQMHNTKMSQELTITKSQMISLRDSIKNMDASYTLIRRYRRQLRELREENEDLASLTDSLTRINQNLVRQIEQRDQKLSEQESKNQELLENNTKLSTIIEKEATLKLDDVASKAFRLRNGGRLLQTTLAATTDVMETCFTILPNNLMEKGDKELFFQIVSPEGKVLKPKYEAVVGNKTLYFSRKRIVNFKNRALKICDSFNLNDYKVGKGTYKIDIYYEKQHIGSTLLTLE